MFKGWTILLYPFISMEKQFLYYMLNYVYHNIYDILMQNRKPWTITWWRENSLALQHLLWILADTELAVCLNRLSCVSFRYIFDCLHCTLYMSRWQFSDHNFENFMMIACSCIPPMLMWMRKKSCQMFPLCSYIEVQIVGGKMNGDS